MYPEIYGQNLKPRLQKILTLLKLDVTYTRARGECLYYLKDGIEIPVIDMVGGYGSTILGHHPPELKAELKAALDEEIPIHSQGSINRYSALLGQEINDAILCGSPRRIKDGYFVHLANTGAEATEAALKHALMEWREKRDRTIYLLKSLIAQRPQAVESIELVIEQVRRTNPRLIALHGSFHGKTAGALAVTSNPEYSSMYSSRAISTKFITRDINPNEVAEIFLEDAVIFPADVPGLPLNFSCVIGVIIEVIQGEGGVHVLTDGLARAISSACEKFNSPLIVDEIQTGMYRTGSILASHSYGLDPDYVTVGKSLGGGIVKISALLIRRSRYQEQFGILHTSTFAEDDLSSRIALRALGLLRSDKHLAERATHFEQKICEGLCNISKEFPGVIAEVRGRGFMLGVEFTQGMAGMTSGLTDILSDIGLTAHVYASYLLHRHGVRVAPTLSQSNTLRLTPCSIISNKSVMRVLEAMRDLASKIYAGRLLAITSHLWSGSEVDAESPIVSNLRKMAPHKTRDVRRVTFLSHLISPDDVVHLDPMFEKISAVDRKLFLEEIWPIASSAVYHEQEIEGVNGERVCLELRGFFAPTLTFEQSLRSGDRLAYKKVAQGVLDAVNAGSSHVGLGQYTSIVTGNGLMIRSPGVSLTTGNSLTIGFSYLALKRLIEGRGQHLSELTVGVVGVAGNICNVYAQMVADEAGALMLVHRKPLGTSAKFQSAVNSVLNHSKIDRDCIRTSCSVSDLIDCDVVIVGANTSKQIILPEHLKRNALVVDISVPSVIHPSVLIERPDVECFQAGYAQLPMGQRLTSSMIPVPNGQVFACMAETVTVGLLNYIGDFSYGALNKSKVLESLDMAKKVGIELGSLKKMAQL